MSEKIPIFNPEEEKPPEEEERKKKIFNLVGETKNFLLSTYGVDELSVIEEIRLKTITKECVDEINKQEKKIEEIKNKLREDKLVEKDNKNLREELEKFRYLPIAGSREVASRWLLELYGIHLNDLTYVNTIRDKNTGEILYQEIMENPNDIEILTTDNNEIIKNKIHKNTERIIKKTEELESKKIEFVTKNRSINDIRVEQGKIPDDFKEYLRRLRENSHLL